MVEWRPSSQTLPMRHVYSFVLYLLTPFVLGYFLFRGMSDRRWLARWMERFGDFDATGRMHGIVIHAASVGEVNAAAPLVRALLGRWPDLPITVTCFTPTGSERVNAVFGDSVYHVYAPLDLPGSVRRFFATLKPRILVVMETELWPNLFHRAQALEVPLLLSNARLTERSARSWGRFPALATSTLQCPTLIAAQDGDEARRFADLGADRDKVRVCGNLKFEIALPPDLTQRGREWRHRWGAQRTVMVAGSSHEEDERALLSAFARVLQRNPEALLVIAPRYPERFEAAHKLASDAGLSVARMSEERVGPSFQCLVVDRMGVLLALYAAADIVFVGGTVAPVGGHTPLEAAAVGRPLIAGPHRAHIESLTDRLLDAGGMLTVAGADSLGDAWLDLDADAGRRDQMGRAARAWVEQERGALQRTLQIIDAILTR